MMLGFTKKKPIKEKHDFTYHICKVFKEESTNTETNDTSVIKSPISEVFVNLGSMSFNKMTDVISFVCIILFF